MSELIPIAIPLREFKGHEGSVNAVAVFPDKRRMVTTSSDKTLRLWDQPIKAHSDKIFSLDFSPETVLVSGSYDKTIKMWNTRNWQQQGDPIKCGSDINCVRYSPSGKLLAIATFNDIQIYNPGTRKRIASLKGHKSYNWSLTWTPDGARLLTCGNDSNPTIREWDASTWHQVGDPWMGHSKYINAIAINPAGTLIASVSSDNHVRLWRLSDRRSIAISKHSTGTISVTFSLDGKRILTGGKDKMISEWPVPNVINAKTPTIMTAPITYIDGDFSCTEPLAEDHTFYAHRSKILAITTARNACRDGDLSTAKKLLTQDINTNPNNYTSYSHRSFVMARTQDWDHALQDAINSISIKPSLTGYISKGIALCGKGRIRDARAAFDVASMYTDQDSQTTHFLLLIKAIALFGADQHDETNLLINELTIGCPTADTRACHIVQAYLRVQLGIKASDSARHDEVAEHFAAAVNCSALLSRLDIHHIYEDLVVLFGWDLKSLWLTAHRKLCDALLQAGRPRDAVKSYRYMMNTSDDITKANCLD